MRHHVEVNKAKETCNESENFISNEFVELKQMGGNLFFKTLLSVLNIKIPLKQK